MKVDELHKSLINIIKAAIPQGSNLAYTLADILCLGREAVYRRIRGEVPFTFYEIAVISEKLNISIDNITGAITPNIAIFHMEKNDYLTPLKSHYESFKKCVENYKIISELSNTELGFSGNMLPSSLTMKYDYLTRFKTFKWMYQHKKMDTIQPFNKISLPEELISLHKEYGRLQTEIKNSFYTWDGLIFSYIVNDIRYFNHIRLLSKEDVEHLKYELSLFLDELEMTAARGRFENGNKIQLYISSLNFETNYTYVRSQKSYFSILHIFTLNFLTSYDKEIFEDLKNLIKAQQRFSILISETGEAQRVEFFKEQRKLIESL